MDRAEVKQSRKAENEKTAYKNTDRFTVTSD